MIVHPAYQGYCLFGDLGRLVVAFELVCDANIALKSVTKLMLKGRQVDAYLVCPAVWREEILPLRQNLLASELRLAPSASIIDPIPFASSTLTTTNRPLTL